MKSFEEKFIEASREEGHFVFASGRHALDKIEFDNVAKRYLLLRKTAQYLGDLVAEEFPDVDGVVTVANGANVLALPVAQRAAKKLQRPIRAFTTWKNNNGEFHVSVGNIFMRHQKLAIIDDVFTKGTNTGEVAELIHHWGGTVLGVGIGLNRSSVGQSELYIPEAELTVPVRSLITYPMEDYAPEECPNAPSCLQTV